MTALHRRCAAALVVAAGLCALPTGASADVSNPFPMGVWNRPLLPNAPIDPRSPSLASALVQTIAKQGASFAMRQWDARIYVVPPNQPLVPVIVDGPNGDQWPHRILAQALNAQGGVPIPPGAEPSAYPRGPKPDTDSEIVIYQPDWSDGSGRGTGRVWEFWHASSPEMNAPGAPPLPWGEPSHHDRRWHLWWGGRISYTSTSPGHPVDRDNRGANTTRMAHAKSDPVYEDDQWLGTATSLSLLGGMVKFADWQRGYINHAVGISLPGNVIYGRQHVWPAQRNDGSSPTGPFLEGMRLRLPANYPISPLQPKIIQMLEWAAKTYGFIVWDGAGTVSIRFEQQQTGDPNGAGCPGTSCSNPWMRPGGPLSGLTGLLEPWEMAVLFPWKDLQVVQPANDAVLGPPTAGEPGGVVVPAGQTVHIPVKATSPGGYPLRFQVDRAPVRGTATPTTDGLTYTAAPGQSGLDAVIAHATDGQVSSKPVTLFVYVVPSGGGGTDPLVYGLLAQRRHAAHRPGRRVVRVIVASYQARRLVIRVIHGRHVVARRSVKPSAGPATIVTLRFRGPHGHYHVSARPLGKGYAYGKALKKKVRL